MSGINFNDTDPKATTTNSERFVAQKIWTASADTTTSATYEDISGVTNSTLVIPVTRDYLVLGIFLNPLSATSSAGLQYGISIDDNAATDLPGFIINAVSTRVAFTSSMVLNLTAGSHTFRYQWKRTSGTGTLTYNAAATETLTLIIL